ncbi:Ribosomal protein L11 methyltransferase [Nitratireductor thuwali]|uniref:Ribosomal protein L11 methyltransferase n=2 Tax=Nitratireductor thuwali TaxID=2267699 RepID=A0ABY5MH02_9HYPH|nr:Ribosomal protein L11 methyltransferase [Nitratireductor thuwali]
MISAGAAETFIRANTTLAAPPHVPEIRLHLADEAHDLWQRTEVELQELGLPPPFWAFAWAGGQGLARHLLDHPEYVRGKRVLDFATGSGLVAIAAAMAGASEVLAADTDPFSASACRLNMAANGVRFDIAGHDVVGDKVEADVVLAGDVFYDKALAARIIPWFQALAGRRIAVLVGDPGRAYLPRECLRRLAEYEVPVTHALEDAEVKRTIVWQFA